MEQEPAKLRVPDSSHEQACFRAVYEGETFLNDHTFLGHNGRWHLFHIWLCPESGAAPRANELNRWIGHATSDDLLHWKRQPDVLEKLPAPSWESSHPGGSASYVIEHGGRFFLFYSRYRREGNRQTQQIGLATSPDLFHWTRHPANPVFHPASFWCPWEKRHDPSCPQPFRPECCRDPHIIAHEGRFIMYYVAVPNQPANACAIGHCVSTDLVHWEDKGPVLINDISPAIGQGMMESPCVVMANDRWFLFYTQHLGLHVAVSDSPSAFRQPRYLVSTHASEVFPDGAGGWLISNVAKQVGQSHRRDAAAHTRWLSLARLRFEGENPVVQPLLGVT